MKNGFSSVLNKMNLVISTLEEPISKISSDKCYNVRSHYRKHRNSAYYLYNVGNLSLSLCEGYVFEK